MGVPWKPLLPLLVNLCSLLTLTSFSSPNFGDDTEEMGKVPGRAKQMVLHKGMPSTPRKMKYLVLKGAKERGEHSPRW
jgi:hypothetical protein